MQKAEEEEERRKEGLKTRQGFGELKKGTKSFDHL